ncbi:MAG: hypothetical protein ABR591_12095 [Candidatus Velthaea sp.]
MIRERKALPETVGALFDTAFGAFGRRIGLYAGIALGGFIIQGAVAAALGLVHGQRELVSLTSILASVFIDAFIMGVVTIGVVNDLAGDDPLSSRDIADAAMRRLLPLIGVNAVVAFTFVETAGAVLLPSIVSFALLVLPISTLWAVMDFATVVCAIEPGAGALLIALSVGKSFRLGLAAPNFGRTVLLGLVTLPPFLLQIVLFDQLQLRHVRGLDFWASVPIDAIAVGPIQAVFTVFYLDFVRRAAAAGR